MDNDKNGNMSNSIPCWPEWKPMKGMYLDLARELKKALQHEGYGGISYNWCVRKDP